MKPDQQRIAIAKACGIKIPIIDINNYFASRIPKKVPDVHVLPNYLDDLNEMHEAEKVLTDAQKVLCYHRISDIIGDGGGPTENCFNLYHATAAQRAEAFLRTLNCWTED